MTSENNIRFTPLVITVCGLMKEQPPNPETFSATLEFAGDEPITEIWSRIEGYKRPFYLESIESGPNFMPQQWSAASTKPVLHPYVEVEVVSPDEQSDYASKRINIDDTFIKFANQPYQHQAKLKFELEFDDIIEGIGVTTKLVVNGELDIAFHRTLRMPDDNRLHQLPASLGRFPLFNVEEYGSRLSRSISERGGIFFPMWQREAMWIELTSRADEVYAVRAFVGNINAISGLLMDELNDERKQDYIVVPQQKWIDGICVGPGVVRQFVAMPLGAGYTVEGQITGEEKLGGLQLEIIPASAYRSNLKHWSRRPPAGTLELEYIYNRGELLETKTPRQEGLNPSDKIRAYPNPSTYHGPFTVSDLLAELPAKRAQVKVTYLPGFFSMAPFPTELSTIAAYPKTHGAMAMVRDDSPFKAHISPPPQQQQLQLPPPPPQQQPPQQQPPQQQPPQQQPPQQQPPRQQQQRVVSVRAFKRQATVIEAMGLAAGGKLIQDITRGYHAPRNWNKEEARLINIHILDPSSFEQITHMVPLPPPMDAKAYTDANLPFYVIQEDVDNRLDGGKFNNVLSVSEMDKKVGVTTEPEFDPFKPKMCLECSLRLCDCIVRPCDHQFCNVCIEKLDDPQVEPGPGITWKCPTCASEVVHVAGFSAPMNLPGEEAFKANVQVNVLKPHGGSLEFQSIYTTRL